MSKDNFWLYDIKSLFSYRNIAQFPSFDKREEDNVNCSTRILIFIAILLMCVNLKIGVIFLFISLIIICHLIKEMSKENFKLLPKKVTCKSNYKQDWETGVWSLGLDDGTPLDKEQIKKLQKDDLWVMNRNYTPMTQGELNELKNSYAWYVERPNIIDPDYSGKESRSPIKGSFAEHEWMNNTNHMPEKLKEEYSVISMLHDDGSILDNCDVEYKDIDISQAEVDGEDIDMSNYTRFMSNMLMKRNIMCKPYPTKPVETDINVLRNMTDRDTVTRPQKFGNSDDNPLINQEVSCINIDSCYEDDGKCTIIPSKLNGTNVDENYSKYGVPLNGTISNAQKNDDMKSFNKELYTNVIQASDENGRNGIFATTNIAKPLSSLSQNPISHGYTVNKDSKNNTYYTHDNSVTNTNTLNLLNEEPSSGNMTDTRGVSYGDPDRCYQDKEGHIQHYYDDVNSTQIPVYLSSNHLQNIYRNESNDVSKDIDIKDINSRMHTDFVRLRNQQYTDTALNSVNTVERLSREAQQRLYPIQAFPSSM